MMKRIVILMAVILAMVQSPLKAQSKGETMPGQPLELTAEDFITKVYGVVDPKLPKAKATAQAVKILRITPLEDEYGLWVETDDGYLVNYYGMIPEVSARASYGPSDSLEDYGYFFLFPYNGGDREIANAEQSQFSGTLLQELLDMGLEMRVDELSDALFEVTGDHDHDTVDVKLVEEHNTTDNSGRFILILHIDPDQEATAQE